jgi:hypothetical protein
MGMMDRSAAEVIGDDIREFMEVDTDEGGVAA